MQLDRKSLRTHATTHRLLTIIGMAAAWLLLPMAVRAADKDRPNFVVIFCDDLGYGDVGCFGSKRIKTPNVDRLATEGMKLTSFYSTSPVCTPSRSSLMTSCYPRRVGMHQNERGGWVLFPGNARGISSAETTLPEMLKSADYATACVGKWHLGDQPEFLPTRHGFDSYFGIPYSNDMGMRAFKRSKYPPLPLLRDEKVIETEPDQSQITKRYTQEAIKFVEANKDKPFFLYWPHTFPHWPFYASKEFLGGAKKARIEHTIEEVDWSVGELMKALKRLGLDDNTLVIFTSDNGGALHHNASNGPLRGGKGSTWEGGMRVPAVARWPGEIAAGSQCRELCTTMDIMPTFAQLAGAKMPTDRKLDGHDISALLTTKDGTKTPYDAFYYYRVDKLAAVRAGDWKLHVGPAGGRDKASSLPALYNLSDDLGEKKNVAKAHPEIVEKLTALAAKARTDLGDGKTAGKGQRPAGHVKNAKTLTHRAKPTPTQVKDDPKLPRVLLIGDSISMGYTVPVRKLMAGKANIHRPNTNCGPTTKGLQQIDQWLGKGKWDVIHFNWGLHDLKYIGGSGKLVDVKKGKQQVPIDQYEKNLRSLVTRMKKTGAVLVWCSTTPVPKGAAGRVPGDAARYNAVAKKVMEAEGVTVHDLFAFANSKLDKIQRPSNVHFSPQGSHALAEQVTKAIRDNLTK